MDPTISNEFNTIMTDVLMLQNAERNVSYWVEIVKERYPNDTVYTRVVENITQHGLSLHTAQIYLNILRVHFGVPRKNYGFDAIITFNALFTIEEESKKVAMDAYLTLLECCCWHYYFNNKRIGKIVYT